MRDGAGAVLPHWSSAAKLNITNQGEIIDTIMFLISIQSSSHGKLVQTILLQMFSNNQVNILPSTNILKDASKVAANGLFMHSLEKSEGVCCKTLQRENLPATLDLQTPLKVALNYVTLKALIEAFQKLQAYICVPKIFSHAGHLRPHSCIAFISWNWASFFLSLPIILVTSRTTPQRTMLRPPSCCEWTPLCALLHYKCEDDDSPIQTLTEFRGLPSSTATKRLSAQSA